MKRYRGTERVTRGVYWSLSSGAFFQASIDGSTLPGEPSEQYVHVPVFLVTVVGPLMGLGFVFFLPLVGIVGLVASLEFRLFRLARWGFSAVVRAALHRGKEQPDVPQLPENPTREDVETWLRNLNREVKR